MKKFIPLLITMLLSIMYAHAQYPRNQQIQAAEYFLNTDPGIGNGTPITIIQGTDITMNLTHLNVPVGSHIYVRVQSTNGFWSAPRCITRYNYSVMTGATLQYGEYFINTDPGQGNAIPINFASGIANLNNQNLQQGDVVYFRIKDSYNRWSPARGFKYQYKDMRRAEYKIKLASNGSYTTTTFNVTAAPDTTCPFTGIKNNITWHTNDSIWVHYQTKEGFYSAWKRGVVASACNDQTVCYGADATLTASGGSSYQWSNSMAGSSILVTPDSATTYHVTVSDGQGSWSTDSTTVFVSPLPLTSANPVGTDTLCQNFPNTSYTTTGALYATSYQWDILPSTAGIITGTGTTGTVDWNSTFYGTATIKVKGIDSCGSGPFSNVLTIVVKPAPLANAGIDQAVCFGTSVTLTATGGGNYAWNNGVTQSVAFTPTTTATYTVSVTGYNGCSTSDNVIVTVNPFPAAAGTISGFATVCQGQNAVMYSVPSIANATSYVWTLPSGATGSSTTNSISLNFGTSSITDYIIVKGTDSCGDGAASSMLITVNPLPSAAGVITGNITVCQGDNATYTVPVITNATNYNWTLPSGVTITSGSGTNSITIHFGHYPVYIH